MKLGPQAVIFDMDGVIVDSEPHHERAFFDVVREAGYAGVSSLDYARYVGRSEQDMWRDFLARHPSSRTLEELLVRKRHRVIELIRRTEALFDGVPELVERLAGRFRLALASGSERPIVEEVLKLRGLGRFFPVVVTDTEVPQGKPSPDIFLRAAELLGVPPRACWVVEDSKPGVAAALAAGMPVIAITNTHPASELGHATRVVSTYAELEGVLLEAAED